MTKKQIRIKDAITIISSFNASQLLLVSEVLKLLKLILTVPATSGVTVPATNGVTVPATNGVTVPTTNGVTVPATNGVTVPATNGVTVPATNGVTVPATNGVTVPATNGVSEKSRRFKTAILYDSRASKFLLILLLIKKK